MKKISFVAIIATIMAIPAFADIAKNDANPTCDSTTIGATSGDTALDATWTANTLNLKFMANGQQFASNTCTYGQNITIPAGTPTRTGYNFAGWQLRVSAPEPTRCSDITDESICNSVQYEGCSWNNNKCMVFSTGFCDISTQSWCEANDLYWNGTECKCRATTCEPCGGGSETNVPDIPDIIPE